MTTPTPAPMSLDEQIAAALFRGYGYRIERDELWPGIEPDRIVRDRTHQSSNPANRPTWEPSHD